MNARIKYFGLVGAAAGVLFSVAVFCASASSLHKEAGLVWRIATYPVTSAWEAFFRTLEGDGGMMFILPMLATQVLFVAAVGFGAGALACQLVPLHCAEQAAPPNGGPATRMDALSYNQKRTKADFAEWASQWLTERLRLSRLYELHRRDRESKRMNEEAFVVYRYVKEFYRDREISIELRDGSQNFDAIIYAEDGAILEYLEATVVPQENDHNLRHELADKGGYSLTTILTHHPSLAAYAGLVSEGIRKKLAKDYPAPTTLLVELASEMVVEDGGRFDYVISHIDPAITAGKFSKIVIFDEPGTHYYTINAA